MHLVLFSTLVFYCSRVIQILQIFGPCSSTQENNVSTCTPLLLMHTFSIALGRFDFSHQNPFTASRMSQVVFIGITMLLTLLLSSFIIATLIQASVRNLSSKKTNVKSQFLYFAHSDSLKEIFSSQWSFFQGCNAIFISFCSAILIYILFLIKTESIERRIDALNKNFLILGFFGLLILILISISAFIYFKRSSQAPRVDVEKKDNTSTFSKTLLYLFILPFRLCLHKILLDKNESEVLRNNIDHSTMENSPFYQDFQLKSSQNILKTIKNNDQSFIGSTSNCEIESFFKVIEQKVEDLRLRIRKNNYSEKYLVDRADDNKQ